MYFLADLLSSAAYAAMRHGSDRDARDVVERAMPIARQLDNPFGWLVLQGNLALARLFTGEVDLAFDAFRAELTLSRELRVLPLASEGLVGLVAIAAVRNNHYRA